MERVVRDNVATPILTTYRVFRICSDICDVLFDLRFSLAATNLLQDE